MSEIIVMVDEHDNELGFEDREVCHDGEGILHRAFMALVIDQDNNIILARRSSSKRLWPMFWDSTVSSHPRKGESYFMAASRRISEELGIEPVSVEYITRFHYQVPFMDKGAENELCAILFARVIGKLNPNPADVSELKKISFDALSGEFDRKDNSPWMVLALQKIVKEGLLQRYLNK